MPCTCIEPRFDTTIVFDEDTARADSLRANATRTTTWSVCRGCGWPTHPHDLEWLFKSRLCTSCAYRRLDDLLNAAARRHGRTKLIKLLKGLAK
jgi:hypothetical protein